MRTSSRWESAVRRFENSWVHLRSVGRAGLSESGKATEMSENAERVKRVVAETLHVDLDRVKDNSRFVEDLGAESVQSVELVAAFEEEFDIDMDEEAALQVKSVGDAIGFIEKYLD